MKDEDYVSFTTALEKMTALRQNNQNENKNTRKTWSDIGNKQANYLADVSAWTMENNYENIID